MRTFFFLSGLFLLLQACSSSNPDWVTEEGPQTIYLIGPVYKQGEPGSYRLSLELKKRISTLLLNRSNSPIEIGGRQIYLRTLDWNLYGTGLLKVWIKLNSEIASTESAEKRERVEEILKSVPGISGKYLLFLKIVEESPKNKVLFGIRVTPGGKIGAFKSTFNQRAGRLRKKIDTVLLKLISSKSYSSPELNKISFEHFKEGCFVYSSAGYEGTTQEIEKCVSEFYLNKYPVTRKQWSQMLTADSDGKPQKDNYPKTGMSYREVEIFLNRLNDLTGLKYRLPTEDEWEYACRLGRGEGTLPQKANLLGVSRRDRWLGVSMVDKSHSDKRGLHDMIGNIWEWTSSRYFSDREIDVFSRVYEKINSARRYTIKGGSFASKRAGDYCGIRKGLSSQMGNKDIGFRLVLDP